MTKIAHIADIHIFRKNHGRIRYAWDEFMSKVEDNMIVIAGDIFEDKVKLYSSDIDLFNHMVKSISDHGNTCIIIAGNHDFNNPSTDLISGLLSDTNYTNIHYLRDSGVYEINNIQFIVYSPIDNNIPNIDNLSDKPRVAIAHESVRGSEYDTSIICREGRFDVSEFTKYDITCLGDIHVPQFLDPRVAYCGSFVQKNKGEGHRHGYILWDVESKTGEFHNLTQYNNDVTLRVKNDQVVEIPDVIDPKNIILEYSNCSGEFISKVREQIDNQYNSRDIQVVDASDYKLTIDGSQDIRHHDVQQNIIKEHLEASGVSQEDIDAIIKLHNGYMQDMDTSVRQTWKLKYLQWSNIYKYDKVNYIDFRNLKNIVVLAGENAIGKTSLISILTYILFGGKSGTSIFNREVILNNSNQDDGYIQCCIEYDNSEYRIERFINRINKDKLTLYKDNVVLECGDIEKTYAKFKQIVGSREDFLAIPVAQQSQQSFLDMDNNKKTQFISRILGIDNLASMVKRNKEKINELRRAVKELRQIDITIPDNASDEVVRMENEIRDLTTQNAGVKTQIQQLDDSIKQYSSQLYPALESLDVCIAAHDTSNNIITDPKFKKDYRLESLDNVREYQIKYQILQKNISALMTKLGISVNYDLDNAKFEDYEKIYNEISKQLDDISINPHNEHLIDNSLTDGEINRIINQPYNKPVELLIQCDESAPFEVSHTRDELNKLCKDIVIHHVEKYDIIKRSLMDMGNIIVENNVDNKIRDTTDQIRNLEFENSKIKAVKCDDPIVKNFQYINILENDLNKIIIPNYNASEHKKLLNDITKIDSSYSSIQFNDTCACCTKNKVSISNISGKARLLTLKNKYDREKKMYEENTLIQKTNKNLLARTKYGTYMNNVLNIETLKEHLNTLHNIRRYTQLTNDLTKAEENIKSQEMLEKYKIMLYQLDENTKYVSNSIIKQQWDNYNKYKIACNMAIIRSNNKMLDIAKDTLPIYYQYIVACLREFILYIEYNTAYDNYSKYNIQLDKHRSNEQITATILEDTNSKIVKNRELEENTTRLNTLQTGLATLKTQIDHVNKIIDKKSKLDAELKIIILYDTYMNDKKGIIAHIIKKKSSTIQNIWNKKLISSTNFQIGVDFSKDKFDIKLIEFGKSISAQMASGFQKFILDITFRETIYKIAQCKLPEFFIIDEGFGTADESNRMQVKHYMQSLAAEYNFLMMISHIEELNSVADHKISIERIANNSQIRVGDKQILSNDTIDVGLAEMNEDKAKHDKLEKKKLENKATKTVNDKIKNELAQMLDGTHPRINENTIGNITTRGINLNFTCNVCGTVIPKYAAMQKHLLTKVHMNKFLLSNQ